MGRKDEAYQYLKNAILSNKLKQGEPIAELTIAEELQMSRTPIREAMRILEHEGLIVSYPARGSFVSVITPLDIEEIYDLRLLLESWALERSFAHITTEELDDLERRFQQGYQTRNWETLHEADKDLHALFINKSGSKRIREFVDILNGQSDHIRHTSAMQIDRIEQSYHEHMEIIRNIREGNLQRAKDSLHHHLRSVSRSAIEVVRSGDYRQAE